MNNGDIYIVADSDTDGIVLYNSSDSGKSWVVKDVTANIIPPSSNPNYPMIYANDEIFVCTFTESGNIFITNSTDYGLNWNDLMMPSGVYTYRLRSGHIFVTKKLLLIR